MKNISSENDLKYLKELFAYNRYLYRDRKLISKKEYISNHVKILNKMSGMLCNEYELQLIKEALGHNVGLDRFRMAINSLSIISN